MILGKITLTAIKKTWASLNVRIAIAIMVPQRTSYILATRGIVTTMSAALRFSIITVLNLVRLIFLLSPMLLSIPQIARANEAGAAYATIDDSIFDNVPRNETTQGAALQFGPFVIISATEAQMNGVTDETTPGQFRAMISAYPAIKRISMVDCPGTENDDANLEVARLIRRAGIGTHVPAEGSVRSGGVELFLAGLKRTYEKGAQFGVHSWIDEDGMQARDVPANDPINAAYISYYQEVGLPLQTARAFYEFTNRTAFDSIHFMSEQELVRFQIAN